MRRPTNDSGGDAVGRMAMSASRRVRTANAFGVETSSMTPGCAARTRASACGRREFMSVSVVDRRTVPVTCRSRPAARRSTSWIAASMPTSSPPSPPRPPSGRSRTAAFEQADPESLLVSAEPAQHGRVVDPEAARGARKRAGVGDGEHKAQVVPIAPVRRCRLRRQRCSLLLLFRTGYIRSRTAGSFHCDDPPLPPASKGTTDDFAPPHPGLAARALLTLDDRRAGLHLGLAVGRTRSDRQ